MPEPQPKTRVLDHLLEAYVKIGGFIGVGLAAVVFAGVCAISYRLFLFVHLDHLDSMTVDVAFAVIALIAASVAAVATFFCAGLFWLPILLGLVIIAHTLANLYVRFHH